MNNVRNGIAFLENWIDSASRSPFRSTLRTSLISVALLCVILAAFVHLTLASQTIVCFIGIGLFLYINRYPGPVRRWH